MSDATDIPYFRCWAAETLSDERFMGWTCEERGAFWTLLCLQWREGSIPADHDSLRRFLHLDGPTFSTVWQAIGNRFAPSDDAPGRLINPRMAKEREDTLSLIQKRSEAGEKGANARWAKGKQANGKRMVSALRPKVAAMPKESKGEERRATPQRGGLQTEDELVGGANPGCAALRLRLGEEGLGLTWPAPDKRQVIEAAVARCGVEPCVFACIADAKGMKQPPVSLGIFASMLARLRAPALPATDNHALPWWHGLPDDAMHRYRAERAALDPSLADAPPSATGVLCPRAVEALWSKYAAEARQ